jgi:hypothetical protein
MDYLIIKTEESMNEFISAFSEYSNSELLKIIKNPKNYQPSAVEAAKFNLENRNLSSEDIESAQAELEQEKYEIELKKTKSKAFENKAQDALNSVIDTIHPIQKSQWTTDKTIKVFCIIFGVTFFVFAYQEFGMMKFMLTVRSAKWDFPTALYFLPLVLIPTATIFFYLKKKIGWTLFVMFLTYNSISSIYTLIIMVKMQQSGFSYPSWLFPTASVGTIFFFIGSLWVICKADIRGVYGISKKAMLNTIGFIGVITALSMFGLFKC